MSSKEVVTKTYGAEVEKPIVENRTGKTGVVTNAVFDTLQRVAQSSGEVGLKFHLSDIDETQILGVVSTVGEQGLDNGRNNQETATRVTRSLAELEQVLATDARWLIEAFNEHGLAAVNLAIHPLGRRDMETYRRLVVPKGIYPYLWDRGWDHSAGIDASAQNSASTGVRVEYAARAASVVIGAGAAFVGIFGNSPFQEGQRSGYKEARLTMWDRMLSGSKVPGDFTTSLFPDKPFTSLADYYRWMFGEGTGMHFILGEGAEGGGYKGNGNKLLVVEGNPPFLDYLAGGEREARYLSDIKEGRQDLHRIRPVLGQMEPLQFAQFAGARVRYAFKESANTVDVKEFVRACKGEDSKTVEELLEPHVASMWIEGRDPGNNLPDAAMVHEVGEQFARSARIGPSAIQAGLLQNFGAAEALIRSYNWHDLAGLRQAAIKDGMQGEFNGIAVRSFAEKVLQVAGEGLSAEEHWMLLYAQGVVATGKNGADRAIQFVDDSQHATPLERSLAELVKRRRMVL